MDAQQQLAALENEIAEAERQSLTNKLNQLLRRKFALERKIIELEAKGI